MTSKQKACHKCAAPVVKYNTATGHRENCPVHLQWLQTHTPKPTESTTQAQSATQTPSKDKPKSRGLGDIVEQALTAVGITTSRVEKWLGMPCSCTERKNKLNKLGEWASRAIFGNKDRAQEELDQLIKVKK